MYVVGETPAMDFDFHSTYSKYSNVELLKIILQKELYQSTALKAAEGILAVKNVTEDEWAEAASFIYGISKAQSLKKERIEKINLSITSRLRMFLFPAENTVAQHIKVFSIIYFFLWILSSISVFRGFFLMLKYGFSIFDVIFALLQLSYLLIVYWLYRLDRKGWVMLFIYSSFSAGVLVYMLYKWIDDNFKYYRITGGIITQIIIYAFIFYYFNRKDVLEVLRINKKFQTTVLVICGLIFLFAILPEFLDLSYYFS